MKKKITRFISLVSILLISFGVWYNIPIDLLDLDTDEVMEIVIFNGNSRNVMHIKDENQIHHIIDNLNEIEMKI